jgi:hypothetical protein
MKLSHSWPRALILAITFTSSLHGCGGSSSTVDAAVAPPASSDSAVSAAALKSSAVPVYAMQQVITVDGDPSDTLPIPLLAEAPAQNAAKLRAVILGGELYLLIQGSNLAGNYNFFFNADGNAQSGHQSPAWPSSGADYLLSNGALYRSTGPGWSWQPIAGDVSVAANAGAIKVRLSLQSLGLSAAVPSIGVGFQLLNDAWVLDSQLPSAGTFANAKASPLPGPSFPVGKGVIIPAYIGLDDSTTWKILEEGAAVLRDGSSSSHKDYWVAVNSDRNGPFIKEADWNRAKAVWDPIRANGGRIFGYVHTLVNPDSEQFRVLTDVKADITAWVAGYPNIDGIWLDEFYPRYEIAPKDGARATFPNGEAAAPTDRRFLNPDNTFNAQQVNPVGGYYDQLVQWIRTTYPQLRIIGNAGGQFYSNQVRYGDLVDVLVSFEETLARATGSDIFGAPNEVWGNLNRQNPGKIGQLALIHSNGANLADAVNQSFARGYTHVYTTDRVLNANIWGGIPPYLTTELQLVASRKN